MKSKIKSFFNNWITYFPLPVIIVDHNFRVIMSNNIATVLMDFNFKKPQYLENYFDKSLLSYFIEFKNRLKEQMYSEQDLKFDHLGHTKMIGHFFDDELGYYIIMMHPLVYKENYLKLKERYSIVLHNMKDSVLITDSKQKILETNAAFTKITGYEYQDVKGRFPTILSSGRQNAEYYKKMYEDMANEGFFSGELVDRRKSGEIFYVDSTIIPLFDDKNEIYEYIGILKDITEIKSLRNKVTINQNKDKLTGVQSRESFLNILEVKCELANEENQLALLFIDLNKFKQVNDTFGHQYGDFVLATAASRMKKVLRNNDLIGRYGGDEFLILLERVNEENTYKIAKSLNEILSNPYIVDEQVIDFVSGSIGIAFAPKDSRNVGQLIEKADSAMYHAKKDRKNDNILMAHSLSLEITSSKTLKTELMNAIDNDEFYIRIQPILSVSDKKIVGGEVLARWLNLYFDEVMPGTFMPLTQTLNITKKFDKNILRKTIETLQNQKLPEDFFINVNFSAEQFGDIHFIDMLKNLSKTYSWLPKYLVIEITESTMMANIEQTSEYLNELRNLGFKMAIDDFGTGFSSLAYLKHFSIDYLKIDISFIENIEDNEKDRKIIEAVAILAKAIGARSIIEGVERESQYEIVKELDIDYMQGFLFYKPMLSQNFFSKAL